MGGLDGDPAARGVGGRRRSRGRGNAVQEVLRHLPCRGGRGGAATGPNLFGVVGRKAGEVAAFKYSEAFAKGSGGIVWDESTLDRWLADPQSVIPGAIMPYKQADPDKRRLVIEYLKTRR